MTITKKANLVRYLLLFVVLAISIIGLVMLYSTTAAMYGEQKLKHQCVWITAGVISALVLSRLDYRRLGSISHVILLAVTIPLFYLALVHILSKIGMSKESLSLFPFVGDGATKGAYRWLKIGRRTIQPSEFAKVAIIIFIARYYGTNPRYLRSFKKGLLYPGVIIGAVLFAILLGGSLSATVITGSVVGSMLFIAGIRLRYLLILVAIGAALFTVTLRISPERWERFISFQDPEKYKDGAGYQLYSSQLALGSGYWYGVGFNRSRMKEFYLPEADTDFIMAIVGEELGFVSVLVVITLYLLFVAAAFLISAIAVDREGMLLAFGIGMSIGLHSFVNIGVVSGFLPTTGVTAPLISYGGSSMLVTWVCIGLLASIIRVLQVSVENDAKTNRVHPKHNDFAMASNSRV